MSVFVCVFVCVCVCLCAHLNTSAIHTPARLGVLPLSVDEHQNKRQGKQSQDAGPHGQGHWHGAWGSNKQTPLNEESTLLSSIVLLFTATVEISLN